MRKQRETAVSLRGFCDGRILRLSREQPQPLIPRTALVTMRPIVVLALAALALLAHAAAAAAATDAPAKACYAQPFGVGGQGDKEQVTPRNAAPGFSAMAVINEKFERISLQQYLDDKRWVVLLFYPFDFTFVCPTEILSFSAAHKEFAALDTQVLAISTDSHHTHLAWVRTPKVDGGLGGKVDIPLVADTSKQISKSYGVLVEDESDDMHGASLRGLFIIDPTGKVRSLTMNDDQAGRNVDETIRLVKAFQYAATHVGEVCPASWQPGQKTIHANPDGIRDYFRGEKDL